MFSNRPSLSADFNTFDVAFKPLFPLGDGGRRVSAEYLIMKQLCNDALEGKRKAVSVIMRYARAQEDARAEEQRRGPKEARPKADRERRATTAMRLLSVASLLEPGSEVSLEPWVADLALSRDTESMLGDATCESLRRYVRDRDAPAPPVFRLPVPQAATARSPADTRFKKGQSGNPKGRPPKVRHDVPLTGYLEEIGTVRVHGTDQRMTRLQFVLHMLNLKALKGDACMTAVLAGKYLPERLQRHKRGEHVFYQDLPCDDDMPSGLAHDPFERLLRELGITNKRTKTRVLLEPWVVEAALARFGDRRLTLIEQAEVLRSTSKPCTVAWPGWWEIRTHADAKPYRPIKPRAPAPERGRKELGQAGDWQRSTKPRAVR